MLPKANPATPSCRYSRRLVDRALRVSHRASVPARSRARRAARRRVGARSPEAGTRCGRCAAADRRRRGRLPGRTATTAPAATRTRRSGCLESTALRGRSGRYRRRSVVRRWRDRPGSRTAPGHDRRSVSGRRQPAHRRYRTRSGGAPPGPRRRSHIRGSRTRRGSSIRRWRRRPRRSDGTRGAWSFHDSGGRATPMVTAPQGQRRCRGRSARSLLGRGVLRETRSAAGAGRELVHRDGDNFAVRSPPPSHIRPAAPARSRTRRTASPAGERRRTNRRSGSTLGSETPSCRRPASPAHGGGPCAAVPGPFNQPDDNREESRPEAPSGARAGRRPCRPRRRHGARALPMPLRETSGSAVRRRRPGRAAASPAGRDGHSRGDRFDALWPDAGMVTPLQNPKRTHGARPSTAGRRPRAAPPSRPPAATRGSRAGRRRECAPGASWW